MLECYFAAQSEDTVGSGEGVADEGFLGGDALVVFVVGLEIASLEGELVAGLVVEAKADAGTER